MSRSCIFVADVSVWTLCDYVIEEVMAMQGMDVGRCELVLHVRPCEGLMRQLDGTVEKRFAKKEILYPLQVCM